MSSNYARNRQGCLTCRRRKKRRPTDPSGGYQSCVACNRLNLRCIWEPRKALTTDGPPAGRLQRTSRTSTPPSLSPALEYGTAMGDDTNRGHRRTALRYYVQSFAATLSTNEQNNGFLSVLFPMAMESRPLLDALVAWSTSHLALHNATLEIKALEDRSTALCSFAVGLRELPSDLSVAVCLVLTSMDSVLGRTCDWYGHLAAAASIIRSTARTAPISENDDLDTALVHTAEGRWLLRNFAYHDVLASISLDRDMLIPCSTRWLLLGHSDEKSMVDTYLGVGSAPVSVLGKISTLSRHLFRLQESNECTMTSHEHAFAGATDEFSALEKELVDWQVPEAFQDRCLQALAETYRSAALICLYRSLRRHGLRSPESTQQSTAEHVSAVMVAMEHLPPGCLPECTLLFPLFIAGGETKDPGIQHAIAERMTAIAQSRSFTNVQVALDVLREVWDVQARTVPVDASQPYDWSCVLERRKWELALS